MIYALFGPPGVGKTYIGRLVGISYDLPFFDADELISEEEALLLRTRKYTQIHRDAFIKNLTRKVDGIVREDGDLILAEAFTKEKNRIEFSEQFENNVQLISVISSRKLARMRTFERLEHETHVIDADCFDFIWDEFDEPLLPHIKLRNTSLTTDTQIISDFDKILRKAQ